MRKAFSLLSLPATPNGSASCPRCIYMRSILVYSRHRFRWKETSVYGTTNACITASAVTTGSRATGGDVSIRHSTGRVQDACESRGHNCLGYSGRHSGVHFSSSGSWLRQRCCYNDYFFHHWASHSGSSALLCSLAADLPLVACLYLYRGLCYRARQQSRCFPLGPDWGHVVRRDQV